MSRTPDEYEENATSVVDSQFLEDVLAGLQSKRKYLHCKYLYDQRGSQLFDQICQLQEYYPTRVEAQITRQYAGEMGTCVGSEVALVEYGSGSSTKTRILLDHLDSPRAYLPVDISEEHLHLTANDLSTEYAALDVHPIVADFTDDFDLPETYRSERLCVYFPGSTIGNLEPEQAIQLLKRVAWQVGSGGGLLIGFDLQKSAVVLERAYDDREGVTAKFNLNLLHRMNRELDANFVMDQFAHVAFYNPFKARIEIYIESLCDQQVDVANHTASFEAGERILTEYSHKYTIPGFREMCSRAGLAFNQVWTDEAQYFAVMHLRAC